MKTAQWFAVAVVTAASLPLMALQIDANATANGQQNGSATVGNTHVSGNTSGNVGGTLSPGNQQAQGNLTGSASASGPHGANLSGSGDASTSAAANKLHGGTGANGSAFAGEQMRPVTGELESRLDSKKARPGETVIFKTTEKMTTADGTEIPKGTRLIGHVTSVQAHAKGHADSQLGLVFDRAELKGGRSIPIHSMIESVFPRPIDMVNAMDSDAGFGGGMAGGGRMAAGPVMAGGGVRGSGLLGGGAGLVGGTVGGVDSTAGRVGAGFNGAADSAVGAAGETVGAAGHVAGGVTGEVGSGLNGAAQGSGSLAARATGIPGVMLTGDASGAASGMLSATGRNIQLESGTQMVLGVAAPRQ